MQTEFIPVKLEKFDGPLGLLLHLVQKDEMNIRELNINKITQHYLDYLQKMQEINFDVAGDYLYMAATLLYLKSKNCVLDQDEKDLLKELGDTAVGDIQSQADLIRRLEQLQRFQVLSQKLWDLPKRGHEVFTRPKIPRKTIVNSILPSMEVDQLTSAMIEFIQKEKRKFLMVKRDRLSIKEKLVFLKKILKQGEQTTMSALLDESTKERLLGTSESDELNQKAIDDIVITFISLLELARLQKISVFQNEIYGQIYVDVLKELENLDIEAANGFEDEDPTTATEIREDQELEEAIEKLAETKLH